MRLEMTGSVGALEVERGISGTIVESAVEQLTQSIFPIVQSSSAMTVAGPTALEWVEHCVTSE
jgi:hypothetical protein